MFFVTKQPSFSAWTGFAMLLLGLNGLGTAALATNTADASDLGIDPVRYRENVERLTSDEMEGRRVGTPGGGNAIDFMETMFREAGLVPPEALGGYRQPYRHDWHGEAQASNVIGILPGTDPELKDEVVVVLAHHDGLGRNRNDGCPEDEADSRIRYGANDNASGSAALIELAFVLAAKREELRRTVVFLSTDGEECGCTGVKNYVLDDPLYPNEDTIYALNIDQIGEGGWLEKHPASEHHDDYDDCEVDGEVFARRHIPAATLVGDNANYHQPDDITRYLDFAKALDVVKRAHDLVWKAVQGRSS
jgi:Zn-dependent M28 family amino/carboxypeptidase